MQEVSHVNIASMTPRSRLLQVCNGVTSAGLATLAQLRRLRVLELSYTEIQVRIAARRLAEAGACAEVLIYTKSIQSRMFSSYLAHSHALVTCACPLQQSCLVATASLSPIKPWTCPTQDLDVVYAACPRLETLLLTCCGYLGPHALDPLLHAPPAADGSGGREEGGSEGPALPALTTLDVSYCPLPARSIENLLIRGARLEVCGC